MKQEFLITKEIKDWKLYCDDCGAEIQKGLACSKATCLYCKKDLCEICIAHEDQTVGDYRTVYCKTCWDLGNLNRITIDKCKNKIIEYQEIIETLNGIWQEQCRKAREKQTK